MYVISALKYLNNDLNQKELVKLLEEERKQQIDNLIRLKKESE